MSESVTFIIVFLGLINVLRVATYFSLGNLYDVWLMRKKILEQKTKKKKKKLPKIDVIIAAFNEEKTITRCLESVYKNTYENFRVIVANDGSTDKTLKKVRDFVKKKKVTSLSIVSQTNSGKAHALNSAIQKKAKGELVMTLDADSTLDEHALERVVSYFDDKQVVAVAANVRIFFIPTLLNVVQQLEYLMGYRLKKAYTMLNNEYIIGGIGATFRRSYLREVKYYDTDTMTEDIDLTVKMIRKGNKERKVIYGADVLCFTEGVMSVYSLFRQRFRWKFGRFQTLWKNRKLFFKTHKKYSKLLTFFQLPFVIYSELTFLFDPFLVGYIIFLSLFYQDATTFQEVFLFMGMYMALTVIVDEYLPWSEKLLLLALSPLAYFFFGLVSLVEYAGLWLCIWRVNEVFYPGKKGSAKWQPVARHGVVY